MDQNNIYRTIFERSDIGVYQTLIEGGVVEANPAMARMFGYETAEEFAAATGYPTTSSMSAPATGTGTSPS